MNLCPCCFEADGTDIHAPVSKTRTLYFPSFFVVVLGKARERVCRVVFIVTLSIDL